MAVKAKVGEKKAKVTKPIKAKATSSSKKKYSKGQTLACEVCGLSVVVNEIGDQVVEEDAILLCCGEPMKEKVAVKKAAKK
jgi:hypothetical protein